MTTATLAPLRLPRGGASVRHNQRVGTDRFAELAAALATGVVAPNMTAWIKKRGSVRATRREEAQAAGQILVDQMKELFSEANEARRALAVENNALRTEVASYRLQLEQLTNRLNVVELELTEWKTGGHGVPGVWVAVPARIWSAIREGHIPALPAYLPGESERREPAPL